MQTTDHELLELAAKAAKQEQSVAGDLWSNARGMPWNPLTDDGDALRLSVKLNLSIDFDCLEHGPIVQIAADWNEEFMSYRWNEWLSKDAHSASRRAIVRAAAAIGRAM